MPFQGIKIRPRLTGLKDDAFTRLAPSESFEDTFDVATTSDLSSGGSIKALAQGFVQYAKVGSNSVAGVLHYKSNELSLDVDGPAAAKKFSTMSKLTKRAKLDGCSGSEKSATEKALSNGAELAKKAAEEAESNEAKVKEYFKDASASSKVADRFRALAKECESTTSGGATYNCKDQMGYCESNVLAYTLPSQDLVVNCPLYYSELTAVSQKCHDQDQVTTTLHEFTHAPGVASPGTEDIAYGYEPCMGLSKDDALNNADSYALFAQCKYFSLNPFFYPILYVEGSLILRSHQR